MYFAISYQRIRTPISMGSHSLDANLIERCFGIAFEEILEKWQEFTSVLVALCSNECCFNFNEIVVKAASFERLRDLLVACIAFVATCYLMWKGISELKYQRYTWTSYVCCSRMQKLLDYTRTRQSLVEIDRCTQLMRQAVSKEVVCVVIRYYLTKKSMA